MHTKNSTLRSSRLRRAENEKRRARAEMWRRLSAELYEQAPVVVMTAVIGAACFGWALGAVIG